MLQIQIKLWLLRQHLLDLGALVVKEGVYCGATEGRGCHEGADQALGLFLEVAEEIVIGVYLSLWVLLLVYLGTRLEKGP